VYIVNYNYADALASSQLVFSISPTVDEVINFVISKESFLGGVPDTDYIKRTFSMWVSEKEVL
jgi:hypothetical protein